MAEHEITKQKVACKILQKANIKNKELEEKIQREIKFSKYFRHPNVIRLFEIIETPTEIVLIMEYAPGKDLFNLICDGNVNFKYSIYLLYS